MTDYYKYYKSDFRLLVNIGSGYKGEDDSIVPLDTAAPFVFRFWTTDRVNPYICSSTGGSEPVLTRCTILDEHRVMCHFDQAHMALEAGRLMLEAEFNIPDADFEADNVNNVRRYYTTSLILTADPDKDSEGDHTDIPLLIDCLKGTPGKSAYEYAVEKGYEGTEEEFAEAVKNNAELGTALAHRVDNLEGAFCGESPIEDFSEDVEYGTGEGQVKYCYKDGLLYKAKVTHKGEWNDDFEETNFFDEVEGVVKERYESVTVTVRNESGEAMPNISMAVKIEGDSEARQLTTDSNGTVSFAVMKGLQYTVNGEQVEGYKPLTQVTIRASLENREVDMVYLNDDTLTQEHVRVDFTYNGASELGTASVMYLTIDGEEEQTLEVQNGTVEFDVEFGKKYTVAFVDITGYAKPASKTYTSERRGGRVIKANYLTNISGVRWLMNDGTERELVEVTNEEREAGRILGLIVSTSVLIESGCSFVIPIEELLRPAPYRRAVWGNFNVPDLAYLNNHNAAVQDYDGEDNCTIIRRTDSSPMCDTAYNLVGGYNIFDKDKAFSIGEHVLHEGAMYQFTSAHRAGDEWSEDEVSLIYDAFIEDATYTIGTIVVYDGTLYKFTNEHTGAWSTSDVTGVYGYIFSDGSIRNGFIPAFGQLYAFSLLRNNISKVTEAMFELPVVTATSGYWWTSTQCNASYGVYLLNGGVGYTSKGSGCNVLPVLAY